MVLRYSSVPGFGFTRPSCYPAFRAGIFTIVNARARSSLAIEQQCAIAGSIAAIVQLASSSARLRVLHRLAITPTSL